MMTRPSATQSAVQTGLELLTPDQLHQLRAQSKRVRAQIGQALCEPGLVPASVFLIEEGTARHVLRVEQQLVTLGKYGQGSWVGLGSLLRGEGCEWVLASTEVVALQVSDAVVVELLQNNAGFRSWCSRTVHPGELVSLARVRLQASSRAPESERGAFQRHFHQLLRSARGLDPNPEQLEAAREAGLEIFIASSNCPTLPLGEVLPVDQALPSWNPPLPLRLIATEPAEPPHAQDQAAQDTTTPPVDAATFVGRTAINLGWPTQSDLKPLTGEGPVGEALATLRMLAEATKLPFRRDAIERIVADAVQRGHVPTLKLYGQLAASMGLHVLATRLPQAMAGRLQTPCLINWKDQIVLVERANTSGLQILSPREGRLHVPQQAYATELSEIVEVLLVERSITTPEQRFNFSWFWPAIRKHRGALLQVLITSVVLQLFTLANPLLIQVIIDKVISQRSLDTLQVLGIALFTVTILGGVLTSLRTFLFVETTNRIDTRLGAEVIDHLLRLPLEYFNKRPVGDLSTRLSELEKIREFLTGTALTSLLDALFSVIYIAVMAMYSWVLMLIALVVIPIQICLTIVGAPVFRRQLRQTAEANAATQSHLVEVLTGIQTVKAQNVELISRWKWHDLYNNYVHQTFGKTMTGTVLFQTGQVLQQISQLMVLWVGASLVLKGELTLGQLIAFRIISGYVTQPLLRLTNIWQSVQELRVSFERLADVVDTPEESDTTDQAKIPLPPMEGSVEFRDVSFHFPGSSTNALNHINLHIGAGTFVGIVGRSGSGKSTLMKLISRLYKPQKGRILVDGYDIDKVELYSLRRQIGIVPQEPLLFAGTVSENIALTNPEASHDEIVAAAREACAHDFIMDLPAGYSTKLGERGSGLSGGQQQRLALARTLLNNPRLLVLDEATSALDYDTERQVCQNLRLSLNNRTVFFITHRLSTIRNADHIIFMDRGIIAESGRHEELISRQSGYYALYRQQEGN